MDLSFFSDLVESKLLSTHTAYLAAVIRTNGSTATVQPLTMIKQRGKTAETPAVISGIPVMLQARYKIAPDGNGGITASALTTGDVVLCVVCERDISKARSGVLAVPTYRHHDLSDSVVVGVL